MRLASALTVVLLGGWLVGCASKPTPPTAAAPAGAAPTKGIVVPDQAVVGKVARVNPVGRFAILTFPVAVMPAVETRLNVYRNGVKVGEVKVSGPQREDNIAADITSGDCQPGDEVRNQ